MKAKILHSDSYGGELIEVGGHHIQYGGESGDGFCYAHQSFDCVDTLTQEEKDAVKNCLRPHPFITTIMSEAKHGKSTCAGCGQHEKSPIHQPS